MHWATIWVKSRNSSSTPHLGSTGAQGNMPDFMLEHFIVLYFDVTVATPTRWEVVLIEIAIQFSKRN